MTKMLDFARLEADGVSQEEVLKFIQTQKNNFNSIATTLILEFKLNRTQKFKTLSKTSPELRAAHLIGILEARFNNALLKERTPDKSYQGNLRLYVQDDTLNVAPFKEGTLSIIYLAFEPLREVSQTYPLPSLAMDALIYGALSNMLEIPTDDQNYNKIGFYKNLFREAKNQLALYLNRLYSTNSASRVVRMNPEVYDAMASDLLGASLARFVRLENPAQSLYEFLKNTPEGLNELVGDTLLKRIEGIPSKPLNEANVYDFISLAINSGEKSPISSKLNDLLPELEKKARGAKAFLEGEGKLVERNVVWELKEIAKRQEGESVLEMEERIKVKIDEYLPLLKLDKKTKPPYFGT
ncbi:hypothetical protein [Helicobacter felis]|uniref:hypothetical protein n=1 Tax=Helicobacter felis TaxID=214 RepID=UPI000CF0ADAA|nr:hypothetical protein [Helicobacter felis]